MCKADIITIALLKKVFIDIILLKVTTAVFTLRNHNWKKSAKNNFFVIIILLKYLALCNKNHKCWSSLWELATLHLFWSVLLQVIGSLENPFV